ncbi:MAG: hypothetical protein E7585_05835, partial [Ruminococcaceae bacterium]|nr:hypothetical protein [Oscillospiraceae bacterium]
MKKFTWRLLALLLAMLFVMPMLAACNDPDDQPPDDGGGGEPTVEKEIDIYFIAGQSNAAGTTKIENADTIYADYPELKNGTDPYILYAGNSAGNSPNNTVTYNWGGVKMGLGSNANNFGPEVGMAKELSKYYNAETGKVAGIIKYTHGGTGLCNTEVNTEPDEKTGLLPGNWSPPLIR